jgi:hypothetical protein
MGMLRKDKNVRQIIAYQDSAARFSQTHHEEYKGTIHCFVLFPFFLKYMVNAEYTLIASR